MLKAILVDDEQLSIDMMKNLVEWNRYDVQIVATAPDGLSALELFREHGPNIVITDIKMPGMDGLEFIRCVREVNQDVEIIFISGYADFSFVKEAITLGSANYLLKPVDEMELEKTLQKITRKINEKSISRNLALKGETQKRKKLLHDYLRSGAQQSLGYKLFMEFCPEGAPFLLMSVNVNHETIAAYTDASSLAVDQIAYEQERIEHIAARYAPCLALEDEECAWLLLLRTGNKEDVITIAEALLRFLRNEGKADARVCFSRSSVRAQELPELYAQAMQFVKYSQYLGDTDILGSEYCCNEEEFHRIRYAEYGRQATEAMRRYDVAETERILEEALSSSMAINPDDLSSVYEFCFEVVLCAKGLLAESGVPVKDGWVAEVRYEHIAAIRSQERLRAFMIRVIRALKAKPRKREEQYSQLVREGIDFLSAHYDQNLSLEEICKHLSVSKNYFSYLFKRDTGESLWAYLTSIRMGRAMKLLRETNLKSLEIAYQVGYDNPSYFTKLFKKISGQTPNEYREHSMRGGGV